MFGPNISLLLSEMGGRGILGIAFAKETWKLYLVLLSSRSTRSYFYNGFPVQTFRHRKSKVKLNFLKVSHFYWYVHSFERKIDVVMQFNGLCVNNFLNGGSSSYSYRCMRHEMAISNP